MPTWSAGPIEAVRKLEADMADRDDVLALIEERIEAIRSNDAARATATLAPDVVAFELPPPLRIPASNAAALSPSPTASTGCAEPEKGASGPTSGCARP